MSARDRARGRDERIRYLESALASMQAERDRLLDALTLTRKAGSSTYNRRAEVDTIGYRSTASGNTAQSPDTRRPQYRTDSIGTGQGVFHTGPSVDSLFASSVDVQS